MMIKINPAISGGNAIVRRTNMMVERGKLPFAVNGHPIKIITLSTINTIHPTSSHFMAIMALAARIRPGLIVWIMVAVNPFPSPIPEAMPKNTQNPDQTNSIPWAIRRIQIF